MQLTSLLDDLVNCLTTTAIFVPEGAKSTHKLSFRLCVLVITIILYYILFFSCVGNRSSYVIVS